MSGTAQILTGCALLAGCASPSLRGEFVGRYEAGFEQSVFTPCGSTQDWWVVFDSTTNLDRQVFQLLARLDGRPDSLLSRAVTFARFRGDTSASLPTGGANGERRRLYVTEVLDLRRLAADDCANSPTTTHRDGAI
jgi:hypothetical protein